MTTTPEEEIRALQARIGSTGGDIGREFASLADAHRRAGRLDEAWSLLEDGLERYPRFATAHLVAARVRHDRGETQEAAEQYRRLLDLDPGNVSGLQEAAALAEEDGRLLDAITHLQRLSGLDPFDTELRRKIRALKEEVYVAEEEPEPDDQAVEEPASEDSDQELYSRTLGELYARQGHPGRALDIYRRLRSRDPDDESLSARIRELEAEVGADLDELEYEWVPGSGAVGDEAPPFAWGGDGELDDAAEEEPEIGEEETIAEYFDALLAWEGGGESS